MDVVGKILGRKDVYSKNLSVYWILVNRKGEVLNWVNVFLPKKNVLASDVRRFDTVAEAIRYIEDNLGGSEYVWPKKITKE